MKQVQQQKILTKQVRKGKSVEDTYRRPWESSWGTHQITCMHALPGRTSSSITPSESLGWALSPLLTATHAIKLGTVLVQVPCYPLTRLLLSRAPGDFSIRRPAWRVHAHADREPSLHACRKFWTAKPAPSEFRILINLDWRQVHHRRAHCSNAFLRRGWRFP